MELNNRMTKLINFNARQFNSNEANAKISKLVSNLIPKYFHTERIQTHVSFFIRSAEKVLMK